MNYVEKVGGGGEPLVLVHGFPMDGRAWEPLLGLLEGRRVIMPDLPGFGRSPMGPGPATMEGYAGAVLELLDRLGVKRFAAAGHSMGGYVVLALQRLAAGRLAGLGLLASRAAADTEEGRAAREGTARRAEAEGAGFLAEAMPGKLFGPGADAALRGKAAAMMREQSGAGVAAAARAMGARPDSRGQLAATACPALVLAGRHDAIVPAAEAEAMAAAIPGARLVWAERSGHMPHWEEPALAAHALAGL